LDEINTPVWLRRKGATNSMSSTVLFSDREKRKKPASDLAGS
jgi:hypothetical protein